MKIKDLLLTFVISLASLVVVMIYSNHSLNDEEVDLPEAGEVVEAMPEIHYEYGLPVDSFYIDRGRIGRNQPLSVLLNHYGITNRKIYDLSKVSDSVFDVRKVRTGNPYVAFKGNDSLGELHYLVYEHTPLEYIVFQLKNPVNVWSGEKKIDTLRKVFNGSIETSLWNAMKDDGTNPMLAVELSEIYAWSIDFFGLQKKDSMQVVYEELYVDSISIGIGNIHGAFFQHMEKDFWAIPFIQDSIRDFFDDEGNSLRKAFLKAPLRFSRISSRYSHSRLHPILKIRRPHHGVDYAAPAGTPVYAIGDGIITKKTYTRGGGNMLRIKHNSVYSTAYLHLSGYAKGLQQGGWVKQGDLIGYVGSTGLSTGPHLDFRFYRNGGPVDPLKVEAPPVEPVREENLSRYDSVRSVVMDMVKTAN